MPLNLSTKPSPPSFNSSNSSSTTPIQSRSNAIIWSPASMCEKETAAGESDNTHHPRDIKPIIIKHDNRSINIRYPLNHRRNDDSCSSDNRMNFVHNIDSDKNNSMFQTFNPKNIGFFSHFHKNKDFNMLRQNRTDIFVVNNNDDFLRDNEIARPDSTAHSDIPKSEHDDRKREHRCFQVRLIDFIIYISHIIAKVNERLRCSEG